MLFFDYQLTSSSGIHSSIGVNSGVYLTGKSLYIRIHVYKARREKL